MAVAVGIDLGTTNTVVGVVRDGVAATIADPGGYRLIPSVVSFHPSGQTLVGRTALDRRLVDAASTIYSIKRLIGRPWGSPEVEAARGKLPFELREGQGAATQVVVRGEPYSLPEISAFVLRQAKAVAEASTGEPVERAVITVPANFNDLQRAATKIAGKLAGLEVLRILNEPTAAALAYGPQGKEQERIAVFDLGGGTFDITVLDLAGNVFEVLATAGDTALGGDDIDVVLAERMADDLLKKHRFDARAQPMAFGRLRILAEALKRELSGVDQYTVSADDIVPGDRGKAVPWSFRLTRPELEWASLGIVERTFKVCQQALDAASLKASDLDRVILVGGATRMPMVGRKVEQFFGRPPVVRINPDEVVALGASIQAALLDRTKQKTAEAMQHPRIHERSVVEPLPMQPELEMSDGPVLPVVSSAKMPAAPQVPAPVINVAEAPSLPGQFLPSAGAKELVFDVPSESSSAPFEIELQAAPAEPSRPHMTVPGAPPPPIRPRQPTMQYPYEASEAPAPFAAKPERPAPPPAPAAPPPPPRPAPLLIDVTPHSLGVETVGGFCDMLIDANTPVPCDRTRSFATATDNQTTVRVRIAQGESKRFDENTCLGELELAGIAPGPRGATQIAVTFEIDADGILNVKAKNVATGQETAARIQLVGAQNDPAAMAAMAARQAAHPLAPLG
ncbi:MAG TPA: Hsp70 family protein [Polyangiaceae bacterium]|nr:Hsp70 family protein [Polyangiaceae bacterium]